MLQRQMSKSDPIKIILSFLKNEASLEDSIMNILDKKIGLFIIFLVSFIVYFKTYNFIVGEVDQDVLQILFLLSLISSPILWAFNRAISKCKKDEIGILIAFTKPETEDRIEINKELRIISSGLKDLVKKEKLGKTIKIMTLPDRLCPPDEKTAHELRDNKFNAALIIWGKIDHGNINSKKHTTFSPIRFSFSLRLTQENNDKFTKNLSRILSRDNWKISEDNNLFDRTDIVNNIEKLSLYIIGFVYYGRDLDVSAHFLKRSLKSFEEDRVENVDHKTAEVNTKIALENIYNYKINLLELWSSGRKLEKAKEEASEIIDELKELGFLVTLHNLEAVLHTVSFQEDLARQALDKIPAGIRKKDPATLFNYAYLAYLKGDVVEGTQYLLKATRYNFFKLSQQSPTLARWYENQLGRKGNALYLNFPLGVIYSDLMKDGSLAKESLGLALQYAQEKAGEHRVYDQMIYETQKRLRKLEREAQ